MRLHIFNAYVLLVSLVLLTFLSQVVCQNFIPPLLEAVLGDYRNNIPPARDPEVLSLMAMIINKLQVSALPVYVRALILSLPLLSLSSVPVRRGYVFVLFVLVLFPCFYLCLSLRGYVWYVCVCRVCTILHGYTPFPSFRFHESL